MMAEAAEGSIEFLRDDGTVLVLSLKEAMRIGQLAHGAIIAQMSRTPAHVGACSRECVSCASRRKKKT